MSFKDQLIALQACQEAVDWVDTKTIDEAWESCVEPEWMLWMLDRTPVPLERDICTDMAFDFIKRIEHLVDIPEMHQILANAKKRRNKQDPIARIKASKELDKLIGAKAPDVTLRPAAQAFYQAGQTTQQPDVYDDKEIVKRMIYCAVQVHHASMKEVMDSVPKGSQPLYDARDREIKDDQAVIIRKHVPTKKIKELWTFP